MRTCSEQIFKGTNIYVLSVSSLCHVNLQEKDDGSPGDLLIKHARNDQATVQAKDNYAQRVSIDDKFSLLITQASLKDQKTFTCMVVSDANLLEFPVSVLVYSKHKININTKGLFRQKAVCTRAEQSRQGF